MSWLKIIGTLTTGFNFVPPTGATEEINEVLFPWYQALVPVVEQDELENDLINVTVKQMNTFVQPAALEVDVTINLDIDPQVTPGAMLHLKLASDAVAAKTITLGDGFDQDMPTLGIAADSVTFLTFVFDGISFVPVANSAYVESLIPAGT